MPARTATAEHLNDRRLRALVLLKLRDRYGLGFAETSYAKKMAARIFLKAILLLLRETMCRTAATSLAAEIRTSPTNFGTRPRMPVQRITHL
jgi:hypothetical protein